MADTESLLARCRRSSSETYAVFEELLEQLQQSELRISARCQLQALVDAWSNSEDQQFSEMNNFHFRSMSVNTSAEPGRDITVLEFPSTFSPEAWSFTFYEGLSRYPLDEFCDRQVVELGCGNGWITIALALRYRPARIIGVDINPRAVLCSRINVWLNGLNPEGEPVEEDGFRLIDAVEFRTSDLLAALYGDGFFDRIIGCIPQVLSPDPAVLSRIAGTQSSDDDLYALSNYCSAQGQVEDQFGLGLIARAVEEAVDLLRPTGKLVFNIGGRPGRQVLERLFRRRGLLVAPIWQTRVEQAKDTDIESLVAIEASSSHRFEFFMDVSGGQPISATTALEFAEAGGRIHHALTVYEASAAFPAPTRAILQAIRAPGLEDAHSALDLSFDDRHVAEERLSFLADFLAEVDRGCFPYEAVGGEIRFRAAIASFLESYFQARVSTEQVFVGISRQQLLRNLIAQYRPATTLVDERLSPLLGHQENVRLVDTPSVIDQVCRLARRLKPNLIALTITPTDARTPESFRQLMEQSRDIGALLVVDISDILDLSSDPESNGVFQILAENCLPEHVLLIGGLVRNQVYGDLEVGFCLSCSTLVHTHLAGAAELTYSRAPLVAQRYYHRLIADLLFFQRPDRARTLSVPMIPGDESLFRLNENALTAYSHPAVASQALPIGPKTCRVDYGENELAAPRGLNSALAEAFVRQHVGRLEVHCDEEIRAVASGRFGEVVDTWQVQYGSGIAPLFSALMEHCHGTGGSLLLPTGAYGQFAACASFHGVKTRAVPTEATHGFKMTADSVRESIAGTEKPWLFLNAPIVNPSGAVYRPHEVEVILSEVRQAGGKVIIDSVFAGLELTTAARYVVEDWPATVILGGVSKEFAAAGIRFGYAITNSREFHDALEARRLDRPHSTHFFAIKRLLGKQLRGDPSLTEDLEKQRQTLRERAIAMAEALSESGWEVMPPEGGLFLIARPTGLQGRKVQYTTPQGPVEVDLTADNVAKAAFYKSDLLFNGPDWTGIPGFCRFVLSVNDHGFQTALARIRDFARITAG